MSQSKRMSDREIYVALEEAGAALAAARDATAEVWYDRAKLPHALKTQRNASAKWQRLCREAEKRGLRRSRQQGGKTE